MTMKSTLSADLDRQLGVNSGGCQLAPTGEPCAHCGKPAMMIFQRLNPPGQPESPEVHVCPDCASKVLPKVPKQAGQSLTPRTDRWEYEQECNYEVPWEDNCRTLETELGSAKEDVQKFATEVQELAELIMSGRNIAAPFRVVKAELIEALAQRDNAMAEAQILRTAILKNLPGMKAQRPPALGVWNWPHAVKELEEALAGKSA